MTNSIDTSNNQWNDYWTNDGAQGEVFVSKDGSAHPELADWWRLQFKKIAPMSDIVDLACGAGSVFAHLNDNHQHRLYGADISDDALSLMRQRVPGVTTTVCSADQLPYTDGQFDSVCSQFGVEYAGPKAFEEAARVLAPRGQLIILCHYSEGFIDSRNQAQLKQARVALSSQFIDHARKLTKAAFSGAQTALETAITQFSPAEKELSAACKTLNNGIHVHLYTGFRQLYERHKQYDLADIVGWLDKMQIDIEHNVQRLEHMCRAANNPSEMQAIVQSISGAGCIDIECEPMTLKEHNLPLAWTLTATR